MIKVKVTTYDTEHDLNHAEFHMELINEDTGETIPDLYHLQYDGFSMDYDDLISLIKFCGQDVFEVIKRIN